MILRNRKRRGGWVAESNSLLNCRTGNRTAGSNPALSAIFFAKMRDSLNEMKAIPNKHFFAKMANEDARLHFTEPLGSTSLKKRSFFFTSSLIWKPCLLRRSISFRLWRGQLSLPVKFAPCGSKDGVSGMAHLWCLHGGVAAFCGTKPQGFTSLSR